MDYKKKYLKYKKKYLDLKYKLKGGFIFHDSSTNQPNTNIQPGIFPRNILLEQIINDNFKYIFFLL